MYERMVGLLKERKKLFSKRTIVIWKNFILEECKENISSLIHLKNQLHRWVI